MAAKEEFEVDHVTTPITPGTSFSQLLFGDDDDVVHDEKAFAFGTVDQTFNNNNNNNLSTNSSLFSIHNTPKMLCFGNNYQNEGDLMNNVTPQKSSIITSSDNNSSSASNSCNTSFNYSLPMSNSLQKKRNGSGQEPGTTANVGRQKPPYKKTKAENPTSTGHAKRKEKLGERIAALQQLVSPFGKTDTASVLHEATGYIKFLQDQVQVLCSPYLQRLPSCSQPGDGDNDGGEEEAEKLNLRSRGLCLIPVSCTVHVASTNGADFWSPGNNVKQ
ncbi:transcription factor bHLH113 isoform X2 [Lotus japonicus]|uniref:transcription factor bHLH113 isoform X2 n=1 Tax=Lotus japonicus TaxID=34305 RepID=UPI0025832E62|nr:transcription factor bHLH113 isoform X2 [Lotus japonicus]